MNPLEKVAVACRQLLTEQQITPAGPGTILRDVQAMLDFIGTTGLPSKSKRGNLPMDVLPELNARLSQPITLTLSRPLLEDYPNLAGVYILLRVMQLVRAEKGRVWVDADALARWTRLNPTEQYFALLEAWLLEAENTVLGTDDRRLWGQFESNVRFLAFVVSPRFKSFPEYCHKIEHNGCVSAWNTQLQQRFGLIEVGERPLTKRTPGTGRGWLMEKARRTRWGEAVAWAFWNVLQPKDKIDALMCCPPENADYGFLMPGFQPFFPEWQQTFAPPVAPPTAGVYIVKASLGKVWRRLAVSGDWTLDNLAFYVLDAFDFEKDHLYELSYRDGRGRQREYNHPFDEEGPFASDVTLAASGWPVESAMRFLFDFGDCWKFTLQLERIEPPDPKLRKAKVLDSAGKSPQQYPNYEENDE
jgi:hypothetical protein